MATFAPRPTESQDPWYSTRETYDQSLEDAIEANEMALAGKLATSAAPELIRDTMGTALVAGDNITITPDDGADTITIAATGGGGGDGGPMPTIRQHASNWYQSWAYGLGAAPSDRDRTTPVSSGTNGRIYWWPFFVPEPMTPDLVAFAVKVASVVGGKARVGMFRFDWPGTMTLLEDYGEAPIDATGTQQLVPPSGVALERGWHWYGVFLSADASFQTYTPLRGLGVNSPMLTFSWNCFRANATYGAFAASYGSGNITAGGDYPISFDISRAS